MNAADKIKKARAGLILDHPFFGALSMRLRIAEDRHVQTAIVDGRRIRYNPDFIDRLSLSQVKGVLAHEVLHVAAGHCWRRGGREMPRWNLACDYAINGIVLEAGMVLPDGAAVDDELGKQAAEDIYHRMPDRGDGDQQQTPGNAGGGASQQSPGDGDADDQDDQGQGDGQTQQNGAPQGGPGGGDEQQPDQADAPVPDPGGCGAVEDSPIESPAELEELKSDWRIATQQAAQVAKSMGDLPGELERLVDLVVSPEVDWRDLLRDFVQYAARNDYDWARPNRRYVQRGIILPGIRSQELPPIVVAVDTSGSIGSVELAAFEAEINALLESYDTSVHVVYCDTRVAGTDDFGRADLPLKLTPRGGGGTDFRPVFAHVADEQIDPACLIYLTDLYGRFPDGEPDYPVLWVSTTDQTAPWGQTARMHPCEH